MNKKRFAVMGIIIALVFVDILYAFRVNSLSRQLTQLQGQVAAYHTNQQVIAFTKLFIDKVLNSTGPVSFDTRLQLENSVRAINDDQILNQWNTFVNSKTELDAQSQVKNLLALLVSKI